MRCFRSGRGLDWCRRPASARHRFPGFEDQQNGVFVRLVALPAEAFSEIEKTMTNEALKKQGMTVEKREPSTASGGNAILASAPGDRRRAYPQMAADRADRRSHRAGFA